MTPFDEYRKKEVRDAIIEYFSGLPPEQQTEELLEMLAHAFERASRRDLESLRERIMAHRDRIGSELTQQTIDLIEGQLALRTLTGPDNG